MELCLHSSTFLNGVVRMHRDSLNLYTLYKNRLQPVEMDLQNYKSLGSIICLFF
jgi:hypothetical protein